MTICHISMSFGDHQQLSVLVRSICAYHMSINGKLF